MNYCIYIEGIGTTILCEKHAREMVGERLIDDVNYSADLTCDRVKGHTVVVDLTEEEATCED